MPDLPVRPARPPQPVVPAPSRYRSLGGRFSLDAQLPIVLSPQAGDPALQTAFHLSEQLEALVGVRLAVECHAAAGTRDFSHLSLHCGVETGRSGDAYSLAIRRDGIEARGAGPAGLRYAVETLLQLVEPKAGGASLSLAEIDDTPDFELRGIMLDVSRGKVPTLASLFDLVDFCVRFKLNCLMLYVEHPYAFRRHPEIGRDASPLTSAQLLQLDAYASRNFVDLVPSLQSLGHMERILSIDRYAPLAETEMGWTISPVLSGTYDLLNELYAEFLPNFGSRFFNANCDEPWDLGRGKSQSRSEALGAGGVYLEHVERIRELASAHGKRTMIWGDVVHAHPERIAAVPRDLVLLDWWYEADLNYERVKVFEDNDIDFVVCPGTSTWNSLFPRIQNSCENTSRWAQSGRDHGALGLLITDWGDFGHYNLQGNSWFAYAWAAQESWSGTPDPRSFDRAFSRAVFGDASGAIARVYRKLGAIHDPGFSIPNGSALQYLYFDDVERSTFTSASKPAALARCKRALEKLRADLTRAAAGVHREALTIEELSYAIDASVAAVDKAAAGLDYNAWRRDPSNVAARDRRRLAKRFRELADRQRRLARELRRLWLERSEISEFWKTQRRLDGSIRAMRGAAKRLDSNRPSAAPPVRRNLQGKDILAAIRAQLGRT